MRPLWGQLRSELTLTARRGDALLLNLIIPLGLLAFFSEVKVLPEPVGVTAPVQFLAPGMMALAVMSTSMVSLGISTGFERQYKVLKRLALTPLGRPRLLVAKIAAVGLIEVVQVGVIAAVAAALGWRPAGSPGLVVPVVVLGTSAFAGLGLLLAGSLRAEVNLAASNGLYLALLLVGGMVIPLSKLPSGLTLVAKALPAGALSEALDAALGVASGGISGADWAVLALWAVLAPAVAARFFRWE